MGHLAWHTRTDCGSSSGDGCVAQSCYGPRVRPAWADPGMPRRGVDFRHGGGARCGVLLRWGRRMCTVLSSAGREERIPTRKIVDVSTLFLDTAHPRHRLTRKLERIERDRQRLSAELDVYVLWEVLRHEVPTVFSAAVLRAARGARRHLAAVEASRLRVTRVYALGDRPDEVAVSIGRRGSGLAVGIHIASPALAVPPAGPVAADPVAA